VFINDERKTNLNVYDLMEEGFWNWHANRVNSYYESDAANCSPQHRVVADGIERPDSGSCIYEDAWEKLDISERVVEVEEEKQDGNYS
jgi:hypothetical protein